MEKIEFEYAMSYLDDAIFGQILAHFEPISQFRFQSAHLLWPDFFAKNINLYDMSHRKKKKDVRLPYKMITTYVAFSDKCSDHGNQTKKLKSVFLSKTGLFGAQWHIYLGPSNIILYDFTSTI